MRRLRRALVDGWQDVERRSTAEATDAAAAMELVRTADSPSVALAVGEAILRPALELRRVGRAADAHLAIADSKRMGTSPAVKSWNQLLESVMTRLLDTGVAP